MTDEERRQQAVETYRLHTGKPGRDSTALRPGEPANLLDAMDATFLGSYGLSWGRSDLDMRTKSFLSMAITATLGTEDQFQSHVRAAMHVGVTKEEIAGMLIHFMSYLGAPRTSTARRLVREVWAEAPKSA